MKLHSVRVARAAAAATLVLGLLTPGLASAQVVVPRARDGRTLNDEPLGVRQQFALIYGASAAQQWQREHNIAIRNDLPRASDGRTIASEPEGTRSAFVAIWGADAPGKWALLHSYGLGKAIIDAGELEEAIEGAEANNLAEAQGEFRSFVGAWETDFETLVREKLPAGASAIGAQIRDVSAVLITPATPSRASYLPALEELMELVEEVQERLAALPASPFRAAAPTPPAPVAAGSTAPVERAPAEQRLRLNIDPGELESSIAGARANNLQRAAGEFDEFLEQWDPLANQVRTASPVAFAEINAALDQGRALRAPGRTATGPEWVAASDAALRAIQKYLP